MKPGILSSLAMSLKKGYANEWPPDVTTPRNALERAFLVLGQSAKYFQKGFGRLNISGVWFLHWFKMCASHFWEFRRKSFPRSQERISSCSCEQSEAIKKP